MANNKSDQKRPSERKPAKFHFNPGNMAGKTAGTKKNKPDKSSGPDEQRTKNFNPGNMAGKAAGTTKDKPD